MSEVISELERLLQFSNDVRGRLPIPVRLLSAALYNSDDWAYGDELYA